MPASRIRLAAASAAALLAACAVGPSTTSTDYEDLLQLFADWLAFEQPPLQDGAPDYTAARMERAPVREQLQHCLLYTSPSPRD